PLAHIWLIGGVNRVTVHLTVFDDQIAARRDEPMIQLHLPCDVVLSMKRIERDHNRAAIHFRDAALDVSKCFRSDGRSAEILNPWVIRAVSARLDVDSQNAALGQKIKNMRVEERASSVGSSAFDE